MTTLQHPETESGSFDLGRKLIDWFSVHQRPLPWRRRYDPYEIWVSEVMLQQTQVQTVIEYFHRWTAALPDIPAVAAASEEALLKLWEGLGYYRRVKNLRRAARLMLEQHGGRLPPERKALLALPGIGPYTASAVLSIAFNVDCPAVDGNVERVFSRLADIEAPVKSAPAREKIVRLAAECLPPGNARAYNQALMDLGATLCTPRAPRCPACPVRLHCRAIRSGVAEKRPVRAMGPEIVKGHAAVGVLVHGGKVLIQKRPPHGLMAGLWEFPGGKLESGETPEAALQREFMEELELPVAVQEKIAVVRHAYTTFRITLHAFTCRSQVDEPRPVLHAAVDYRWVAPEDLETYAFPAANRKIINRLRKDGLPRAR